MIRSLFPKVAGLTRRTQAENKGDRARRVAPRLEGLEQRELLTVPSGSIIFRHIGGIEPFRDGRGPGVHLPIVIEGDRDGRGPGVHLPIVIEGETGGSGPRMPFRYPMM